MLFNSYVFILVFLPVTLIGFGLLGRTGLRRAGVFWLVACSMFYYGYWSFWYLQLLLVSMVINYLVGTVWLGPRPRLMRKAGLVFGLVFNLSVLGYFKYAGLMVATFDSVAGAKFSVPNILLPLGISFFTFQKIAYLVDTYKGRAFTRNFLDYCLFVVFFPQLIAGPIVHPREVLPQFSRRSGFGITEKNLSVGLTLFVFGLAKKVLIADTVAPTASNLFRAAAAVQAPGFTNAWLAALAYALQIYFDFSGYTDMAIGLARLFGVRLPVNFNSPYKANSIIDFWRRWHITLSRFLRDYLYVPLGGNRRGKARRYVNLMVTMLLGGLWHGANWTFLVWGGLHGLYLCVNHAWRVLRGKRRGAGAPAGSASPPPSRRAAAWGVVWRRGLTFGSVVVAWVFFRAGTSGHEAGVGAGGAAAAQTDSFRIAGRVLRGMFGLNGLHLEEIAKSHMRWPMVLALIAFCFLAPNTQHLMALARPALGVLPPLPGEREKRLLWRPTVAWALLTAALALTCLLLLKRTSEFIYYQF